MKLHETDAEVIQDTINLLSSFERELSAAIPEFIEKNSGHVTLADLETVHNLLAYNMAKVFIWLVKDRALGLSIDQKTELVTKFTKLEKSLRHELSTLVKLMVKANAR
jgi:hypothetical protein